jgi:DNA-binding transcriptional ArsR family regulator
MPSKMGEKEMVRRKALALIAEEGRGVAARLGKELGLTRQAVSRHLKALESEGLVQAEGSTRARVYHLIPLASALRTYPREGLSEDTVWRELFQPAVAGLPENVVDIWRYGVTEMVNNAVDHSGSPTVEAGVWRDAVKTSGMIQDEGEGIFLKIQRAFGLYDPRESILELAKGKLTTDPAKHTGEGIFFASRVFDSFLIRSGNLSFWHDKYPLDFLSERPEGKAGTAVYMWLGNESPRTLKSVFDEFSAPEEYSFAKTIVPVRLAQYEGEKLVSRSQAKRLSMRFERFRHVVLDFAEVVEIGQAFADELFRVHARAHPQVVLAAVNMSPEVERMVRRAKSGAGETS